MSKSQMIIRLDSNMKNKLSKIARAEGKNSSEVIRELISEYVHERDMSEYIDDLWNRIGARLRNNKVTVKELSKAIRQYRGSR
ncbi:MAG: CopG family transcriptional regulator [Candidatus Dadabacteria bacterium]|nr:CopG family transcriptional regulator [Candidatus Dadabacteria bacterium]